MHAHGQAGLGWAGKVELRGRQAVAAQWGNRRVVNHWSLEHCVLIDHYRAINSTT
jgi:hypothetical protein